MSVNNVLRHKMQINQRMIFALCFNKLHQNLNVSANINFMPKILLVEDHAVIQKAHQAFLQELNCQVDIASTGFQALSLYESNHYDMVLLDIDLPDMKGTTISENIRHLNVKQQIPIIAVTTLENLTQQFCQKAGIDAMIHKPVSLQMLKQALLEWL